MGPTKTDDLEPLKLDPSHLDFLELAMTSSDMGAGPLDVYLDRKEGTVVTVGNQENYDIANPPDESDPDWIHEDFANYCAVFNDVDNRFVQPPSADSHTDLRDMADFAATVSDPALRQRLTTALNGRRAFRRFRDAIDDAPSERQRWFDFQTARTDWRLTDWLASQGFYLVTTDD